MAITRLILALIVLVSTSIPLSAQWLNYPTPGIPRTPGRKTESVGPGTEDAGRKA